MFNGTAIFQARVRTGHSFTTLAKRTGLTQAQVHDIERGRYRASHRAVSLDKIRRLARELGLEVHEIFAPEQDSKHQQCSPESNADFHGPDCQDTDVQTDMQTIAALLISVPTFRPVAVAATLPGWDHSRVRAAIQALNAALAPTGLAVQERKDGVRSLTYLSEQKQRPHDLKNAMHTTRGGTQATMQMAYECINGPVPNPRVKYKGLESRAWLGAAGITRFDHDLDLLGLTEEAAHGLLRTSAGWPKRTSPSSTDS